MDIAKTFWIIFASVAALCIIVSSLWGHYQGKNFVVFGLIILGLLWFLKSFFYVSPKEKRKRKKEEEEYLVKQKRSAEEKKKEAELKKNVERKVAQEIEKKIEEEKVEKTKEAWNRYYERKSFDEAVNLKGRDFEKYLVELLIKKGHKDAKLTKSGADGGIDILFTDENDIKVGIQAKGWKGSVGIDAVHRCVGAMRGHGCERGIVATTSYFTEQAKKYVADQNDLSLWDQDDVKKLHEELFPIEEHSFSMEEAVKLGIVVDRLSPIEEQVIYEKYGFDYYTKEFEPHKCKEIS
jgi:HJR/Mrr/RecB family endonuclease